MDLWILGLVAIVLLGVITLYVLHGEEETHTHPLTPMPLVQDNSGNFVKDVSGTRSDLVQKEKKKQNSTCGDIQQPCHEKELVFIEDEILKPYAKEPIDGVDDYEYSMVFKNEGDRAMTKETRDLLMSQYPMDWSTQPPSSAKFQSGLATFKESFANQTTEPFPTIFSSSMVPPDSLSAEMKEREVLATYVPKKAQELSTYDVEDAKELIDKIYAAKGQKASYKQTGKNQFTIMDVRPLNEKPQFEDDYVLASSEAVKSAGEETIVVPEVARNSIADPFFTPGAQARDRPWDYTRWTPGLERMFSPTAPQKNWY